MLAALLADQGLVSSTHSKWLTTAYSSDVMLSNLQGLPHTHDTQTHIDKEIVIYKHTLSVPSGRNIRYMLDKAALVLDSSPTHNSSC